MSNTTKDAKTVDAPKTASNTDETPKTDEVTLLPNMVSMGSNAMSVDMLKVKVYHDALVKANYLEPAVFETLDNRVKTRLARAMKIGQLSFVGKKTVPGFRCAVCQGKGKYAYCFKDANGDEVTMGSTCFKYLAIDDIAIKAMCI